MLPFLASLTAMAAALTSGSDAMSAPRLEKMLADGDREMITQVFKRHDDDVLPFIDQYLEGGLKMIEEGKSEDAALKSFRTGIAFAKIADEAMPGATFLEYAATFASWSPEERTLFRKGQAEFRAGHKAMDAPEKAAEHFRTSLQIAESLRDLWGKAMAYSGIMRAELALGHNAKVEEAARQAQNLCAQLRLRLDQVAALVAWGDVQAAESTRNFGVPSYQYAFTLLRPTDDAALRRSVLQKYLQGLERAKATDVAAQLREQNADLLGPDPRPEAKPDTKSNR